MDDVGCQEWDRERDRQNLFLHITNKRTQIQSISCKYAQHKVNTDYVYTTRVYDINKSTERVQSNFLNECAQS